MRPPAPVTPSPWRPALVSAAALLLAAVLLGSLVNALRPSPLPWAADWSLHVETLARQSAVPVVYLPELKSLFASPAPPVFVDARSPADYAASRIPGAVSIPSPGDEPDFAAFASALQNNLAAPVVVYCSAIDCTDALDVARNLRDRGFSSVRLYPGGFAEWTRYDNPVESEELP
jgi:rhodanese-related sulfurtransferase